MLFVNLCSSCELGVQCFVRVDLTGTDVCIATSISLLSLSLSLQFVLYYFSYGTFILYLYQLLIY